MSGNEAAEIINRMLTTVQTKYTHNFNQYTTTNLTN